MLKQEVFFLPAADGGHRFCIFHPPKRAIAHGAVLYVHPFAEEMNKSRRMAALFSRALTDAGYGVLQLDMLGCGDSSGDFGDASWHAWKADIVTGITWLQDRLPVPLTLWGLRAGCLLMASVAVDLEKRPNLIFWQPVISGKQYWQQFMRLKVAAALGVGSGKEILESLRQQLSVGAKVEIAGYSIRPELAEGLSSAELLPGVGMGGKVAWLEISSRTTGDASPVVRERIEIWNSASWQVDSAVVNGPAFWQTNEIEEAPGLIDATLDIIEAWQ